MKTDILKGVQAEGTGGNSVAVLRALPGLGDLLCVVPALRALRAALPEGRISLIGLPQSRFLLERFPDYLDEVIDFPGFPGLPEREPRIDLLPRFLRSMQARRFDLLLQLQGSGELTNPLALLLGAGRTAGYFRPGAWCPDAEHFLPWKDLVPETRRCLQLLEHLGISPIGEDPEFPLFPEDRAALEAVTATGGLKAGDYACIHPGASIEGRRWDAGNFASVADRLAAEGLQIVLTGSPGERELANAVAGTMRYPAINLAGQTTLGALAALLAGARVLVCNDTGVSHLAAALGTPSVIVFISTPPARWAPLNRSRHRAVRDPGQGGSGFVFDTARHLLHGYSGGEVAHAAR